MKKRSYQKAKNWRRGRHYSGRPWKRYLARKKRVLERSALSNYSEGIEYYLESLEKLTSAWDMV